MADEGRIRFRCSDCNKAWTVSRQHAGKRGKCPGCGAIVQIPTAETVYRHERQSPTNEYRRKLVKVWVVGSGTEPPTQEEARRVMETDPEVRGQRVSDVTAWLGPTGNTRAALAMIGVHAPQYLEHFEERVTVATIGSFMIIKFWE